jgi:hypothetical protein
MRTQNELMARINYLDPAILECLCDIRLFLAHLTYMQGGTSTVQKQAEDLIKKESTV